MNITVMSRVGEEFLHEHGHTVSVEDGVYKWISEDESWRSSVKACDEGITWIRGHRAWDSPEVQALRVAHALRGAA